MSYSEVSYKGRLIRPRPTFLPDLNKWSGQYTIISQDQGGYRFEPYVIRDNFDTEEEAIYACLQQAKAAIDGY